MTEDDWRQWRDPRAFLQTLLHHLRHPAARRFTDRKLRLFAVACLRRAAGRDADPRLAAAAAAAERFADARTNGDRSALKATRRAVAADAEWSHTAEGRLARAVLGRSEFWAATAASWYAGWRTGATQPAAERERERQGPLLRDVIGNPFRPSARGLARRDATVLGLAGAIYAEGLFDRLPVLADALEEVGCEDAEVLTHCRGDQTHVRGCWVVDAVLGKE